MNVLLSWLFTYWIHSTVLLGIACLLDRALRGRPQWQEPLWKVALVGALLTATAQVTASLEPWGGTWAFGAEPAAAAEVEVEPAKAREPLLVVAASVGEEQVQVAVSVASTPAVAPVVPPVAPPANAVFSGWTWRHAVLGAWAIGAAILLGSLARAWLALKRRLDGRRPIHADPIRDLLSVLAARTPRVEAPRLSATPRVPVPIALGVVRPEICVPERVVRDLPCDAQEALLAHELGHLARRDPLWRLVASVLSRALFFQPLNWLAARRLAACAELLADDWAARRTSNPLALAECLTQVARWSTPSARSMPVPAMAAGASELRQRVERLVRGDALATREQRPLWTGPAAGSVLVALALLAPTACGVAEAKPPVVAGQEAQRGEDDRSAEDEEEIAEAVREAQEEAQEAAQEAREEAREAAQGAREEAREAAQEARKAALEAAREARAEARRARAQARAQRDASPGERGPSPRDRDDDEDDGDHDDDDDDDIGEMHVDIQVPRLDLDVDVDLRLRDLDDAREQLDDLEERLERSLPSEEEIEAMVRESTARAGNGQSKPDAAEARRAQEQARAQLAEARKQMRAQLAEARKQMLEAQKAQEELRARLPEIQRNASAAAEQARKAAEEARKAQDKAQKERDKARKEKEKAEKASRRERDRDDDDADDE